MAITLPEAFRERLRSNERRAARSSSIEIGPVWIAKVTSNKSLWFHSYLDWCIRGTLRLRKPRGRCVSRCMNRCWGNGASEPRRGAASVPFRAMFVGFWMAHAGADQHHGPPQPQYFERREVGGEEQWGPDVNEFKPERWEKGAPHKFASLLPALAGIGVPLLEPFAHQVEGYSVLKPSRSLTRPSWGSTTTLSSQGLPKRTRRRAPRAAKRSTATYPVSPTVTHPLQLLVLYSY